MAHRGRTSAADALAAGLAAGKTVKDAGVAERIAFRRMTVPEFRTRVSALRGEMVATAAGRLADGMGEAAGVLRALLVNSDPNVRHKAAIKFLELGLKVVEVAELERRVAELESREDAALSAPQGGRACPSGRGSRGWRPAT